jgi:hypothetical protein
VFAHTLPKLILESRHLDLPLGHIFAVACAFVRWAVCAAGGHDYRIRRSPGHIRLHCEDCGHETPGWRIDIRNVRPAAPFNAPSRTAASAPKELTVKRAAGHAVNSE